MIVFGQIVLGPPGSGKTKYCTIMQEYLNNLGRNALVINLDPANDRLNRLNCFIELTKKFVWKRPSFIDYVCSVANLIKLLLL